MLKVTCTWISARKDTSGHSLSQSFQGAGTFENDLTDIKKCVGEVSVRCQLELNAVRGLSLFTVKYLKNCGQQVLGLHLENEVLADIHWYERFPLFGVRVLTAEVLPSISDTPCICQAVLLDSWVKDIRQLCGSNGKKVYLIVAGISAVVKWSIGRQDIKGR